MVRRLLGAILAAAAPLVAAEAAERVELRFGQHLGSSELRLFGGHASQAVEFDCPPEWSIQPGAELRLLLEHSPQLDGERSFLVVRLNHGVLRSVRLDRRSLRPTELVVPLPPAMLRQRNRLVLTAEQFPAGGGDAAALWTAIDPSSRVVLPYERKELDRSLADLPEPLLRRRGYEARRLTVLLPVRPTLETLQATAQVVASLVSRVAPAPVTLAFTGSLREATSPVLAVGTLDEQPELRALGIRDPPRVQDGPQGPALSPEGRPLEPPTGLILLAQASGQPVLVVSGRTGAALTRAARTLAYAAPQRRVRLWLAVDDPPLRRRRPRHWDGFLPPTNRFTLDEAGDQDAERAVTSDSPARVVMRATPDTRFLPYGHRLSLDFSVMPALREDPEAVLDVYWNAVPLRREPMGRYARRKAFSLSIPVPARVLAEKNVLTVVWRGRSGAYGPFVMLMGSSEMYLPREYVSELPDLARLRSSFFPFSRTADLGDTLVVLPEKGGDHAVMALCELASLLGRMVPATEFAFRLRRPADVSTERPAAHLIALETGEQPSPFALPDLARLERGQALGRLPLLQELASPWSDDHYVLRLRAPTPALLGAALRSLGQSATLSRLSGDTVFLAAEGPVAFRLTPARVRAEVSYLDRLEAWLRENWLALPMILALVSGLLFLALRLVLGGRRSAPGRPREVRA